MSPPRRYQKSSVTVGVPSTDHYRPITPAEIAVNPVLTINSIQKSLFLPFSRTVKEDSGKFYDSYEEKPIQIQQKHSSHSLAPPNHSRTKGNRTYRVGHYNPIAEGDHYVGKPSLSQGNFGLPIFGDYYNKNVLGSSTHDGHWRDDDYENLGGTSILDDNYNLPGNDLGVGTQAFRPRMRTTLPSAKPTFNMNHMGNAGISEEMDGIIQVRPASRSKNPVYHHSPRSRTAVGSLDQGHCNPSTPSPTKNGNNLSAQRRPVRRVQSNTGVPGGKIATTPSSSIDQCESPLSSNIGSRLSQLPARSRRAPDRELPEKDQLTPPMVENMLQDSIASLRSSDWEKICAAFRQIINISEKYPFQLRNVLKKIIWSGLPHLSSSRTKVSRTACQCFKRLFETQKKSMESGVEGEKVFSKLLDLCGGPSSKFIQEECKDTLLTAVRNATDPYKSISFIEMHGAKHKNPSVREFASFLLNVVMERVSVDKIMSKEYSQKVFPMIVGFLMEGHLNTRVNAKDCLEKVFNHPLFDSKLKRFVAPENIRHVNDTLKKFHMRRTKSLTVTRPS